MSSANNILQNLARIAEQRKTSVKSIIEGSGIPYQTYLSNKKNKKFTTEHIDKICVFLQVSTSELVEKYDPENAIDKIKKGFPKFVDKIIKRD